MGWSETSHPRVPAGQATGGQFTSAGHGGVSRGDYHMIVGGSARVDIKAPHDQKLARAKQAQDSVSRTRQLLKDKGINVDHLNVTITDRIPGDPNSLGTSDMHTNQIHLNVGNRYYDRVYDNQKQLYDSGMHSSPHKDHAITHEMAHQIHREIEDKMYREAQARDWEKQKIGKFSEPELTKMTPPFWEHHTPLGVFGEAEVAHIKELKKVARRVSLYATKDPHEFVAETFTAGILTGRKFSDEVKVLYLELNGPYPDKVFGD